jgi:hypothetical protein
MASFTPQPLYPTVKTPQYPFDRRLRDPSARMNTVEMRKDACPAGNQSRFPTDEGRTVYFLVYLMTREMNEQSRMKYDSDMNLRDTCITYN